jgi:alanine racemase
MSLVLKVDGDRWRAHLRSVAASRPGLVPVIKGNGYGFGLGRLARKSAWLGVDTVAVGTPSELPEVASRYDGDLLVLTPWRSFDPPPESVEARRLIHTVDRLEDLRLLAGSGAQPRVVLELLTSMKRHGFTPRGLRDAAATAREGGVTVVGAALHLPLGPSGGNLAEAERLMTDVVAAGLNTQIWVSHLSSEEAAHLAAAYPEVTIRQRIGTELWLGDRGALDVRAHVLDSHPVERGETFGYRGRTVPRTGTILIVSGGTAHGIGLEAPNGDSSVRARATTLARGGLDALGMARSPFSVGGKGRYFAEPPHMQASMLFLPAGAEVPEIGDTVGVRVRFTASYFDEVDIR